MPSIGMACNVYQEANAVHGLLESASQFFDELFFFHTGPDGAHSTDGTIETIEKWGARLEYGSINDGFGVVRTELIKRSSCEWVMILDADERFYPIVPRLSISGHDKYPEVQSPQDLVVSRDEGNPFNQGALLRDLISRKYDYIRTARRHWFDHSWQKPCQNWITIADWQARILRNNGRVRFASTPKMHEQMIGAGSGWEESVEEGPYHDHFHCHYKRMEPEQRKQDIQIFDAIHAGSVDLSACHVMPGVDNGS